MLLPSERRFAFLFALQMKENDRQAAEEAKKDREILRNRVESDKLVCRIVDRFEQFVISRSPRAWKVFSFSGSAGSLFELS